MQNEHMVKVLNILDETYPDAKCGLNYTTAYELLVATILSAQCTDIRVNKVTARLFSKANTPDEILELGIDELKDEIKECGLFNNKSKNIISMSQDLVSKYKGQVPETQKELVKLGGVGRKTANVVLSNAFDVPAIAVDTHVFRVANRIGLASAKNVDQTEKQLMENLPKDWWSHGHHLIIHHGRNICTARKPKCDICPVYELCEFVNKKKH
ncbi:endonuclease III [Proteinivorax hydrogeniformans]|uniref:Endonuclease III n=1 Tax=Proteinivorax hydrogeniformans TaxID=1826727 RepID=A0AAU8HVY0_9FIRM